MVRENSAEVFRSWRKKKKTRLQEAKRDWGEMGSIRSGDTKSTEFLHAFLWGKIDRNMEE